MCGCPQEKIKDVFGMQLSIVTVFELCKFLKLNPTIIYTYCHLRISVEDLIKFFTFTVREMSRNVGFLWSVFSRVWTESDTTLSIYRKIRTRGSLHFWILHAMSNIVTQEFFLNLVTPLSTLAFLYEGKTRKIVRAIYTFILHIKKQKCCWNEIVCPPAVIQEEKTRFKWTF